MAREESQDGEHTYPGGFVKVPRDVLNRQHPLHPSARDEPACRLAAWVDLLGMVGWRPRAGLEAGETRASVRFLAARWGWSKSTASRFLQELEAAGAIEREENPVPSRGTRIRVLDASAAGVGQAPARNDGENVEPVGQGDHGTGPGT